MTATTICRNRIAVVFDFDLTLAPDSFSTLLHHCGVADPEAWRKENVRPLAEAGWDVILARVYGLVRLSRSGQGMRIAQELVHEAGRSIKPFEGVPEMFDALRRAAEEALPGLEVEFYLLSSGFADVQRAVSFAHEFTAIWGTDLHFDERGELDFPKQIVTHPEKVRYVLQLSKGLGAEGPNGPAEVYRDVPDEQVHVPLDQMIYVGDGGSDMPVFSLLHDRGGIALAVHKSERAQDWSGQKEMRPDRRVQNLAPPDFRDGSELMRSLHLAVGSIAKKVALRRLAAGE